MCLTGEEVTATCRRTRKRIGLLRMIFPKPTDAENGTKKNIARYRFKDIGSLTQFSACHAITRTHSRLLFLSLRPQVGRNSRSCGTNATVSGQRGGAGAGCKNAAQPGRNEASIFFMNFFCMKSLL